jgi:uncharacterized protein (TIGR04255 family)
MSIDDGDLFPESQRVIYQRAPLIQVTCQLRFPSILKIEGQTPADFQEQIRELFPLFEKGANTPFSQLPQMSQLPPEIIQLMGQQTGGSSFRFLTEDRASTVALSVDSLSLSTTKYRKWEEFRAQLKAPLSSLISVYRPAFFARVGLRYIDAIHRESIGLADRPWSQLLRPEVLGELALPVFERNAETVGRFIRIKIPDGTGVVVLQHGFALVQGKPGLSYVIDFDFSYGQRTEVTDAEQRLDHFNRLAGRAFRWCISATLRDALGPVELGPVTDK